MVESRLKNYTVLCDERIIDALTKIDANKQGFIIVVDEDNKMLGVLTDGDVRRAIINGRSAEESISNVYTSNAKKVSVNDGFDIVTELFKSQAIKFLPIIDWTVKSFRVPQAARLPEEPLFSS